MDDVEFVDDDEGILKGGDPVAKVKKLKERIAAADEEKKEYLEGWQRAKADLINFRKDEERRLELLKARSEDDVIQGFLTVFDSIDAALSEMHKKHIPEEVQRGLEGIQSQFMETLKRLGVEVIYAEGKQFDPMNHYALQESESDDDEGVVLEELQRGYVRHGRVIRPTKVKVSKKLITNDK